ncbi:uncharacterized protein [Linepithema humile]|uniref:uncharacterized protein n=1 Tax=Linepithema humile TaxID=83485 RepID=UPI00351F537E
MTNRSKRKPSVFDKTLKDYKNKELKLEIWKSIGKVLGCTGEQVEGRWIILRNTFTKKLREMKNQPSGSGCKMAKMWIYFKQMSFLTPHIAHRMSRSSMTASQEKSNVSQSIIRSSILIEDSADKTMSSPLSLNNACSYVNAVNVLTCSDDSISNPSLDESCSITSSTSNQQSPVTLIDSEDNVFEYTNKNNKVQKKTAADIVTKTMNNVIQKKKVPAPDQFAVKKQKTTETMENVLCQSSHALNVMATAYLSRATVEQHHPCITAIAEAMRRVPNEQQLTCFMSIMQVISTHSQDK